MQHEKDVIDAKTISMITEIKSLSRFWMQYIHGNLTKVFKVTQHLTFKTNWKCQNAYLDIKLFRRIEGSAWVKRYRLWRRKRMIAFGSIRFNVGVILSFRSYSRHTCMGIGRECPLILSTNIRHPLFTYHNPKDNSTHSTFPLYTTQSAFGYSSDITQTR